MSDNSKPITMIALGSRTKIPGTQGDTWDNAWRSNGDVYIMCDDGGGFENKKMNSESKNWHFMLGKLNPEANPENITDFNGVNLTCGGAEHPLGYTYGTALTDIDGILYLIQCYSYQRADPPLFIFERANILKSEDDGKTWFFKRGDSLEQAYTTEISSCYPFEAIRHQPPIEWSECTFPSENWRFPYFVKYGKAGAAPFPDVDEASEFIYIFSPSVNGYYLARIKRSDLQSLDRDKIEYHKWDGSWSFTINDAGLIPVPSDRKTQTGITMLSSMMYNERLRRYLLITNSSDFWNRDDPRDSFVWVYESASILGPWNLVLEENVEYNKDDSMTWVFFLPKFTSSDGKKVWCTFSGDVFRDNYALHLMPLYLSVETMNEYMSIDSILKGGVRVSSAIDGDGYITGFNAKGDGCGFKVDIVKNGKYIIKFKYNIPRRIGRINDSINWYINSEKQGQLKLGKKESNSDIWYDQTVIARFSKGTNEVSIQIGEDDQVNSLSVKSLSLALFTTE